MKEANSADALELTLDWRSDHAVHADRLRVCTPAMQADGRWLTAGRQVLEGGAQEIALDAAPWCQPFAKACIELPRSESSRPTVCGRHYPRAWFGRSLGTPRDLRPVRVISESATGDSLRINPNHPLAGVPARLVFRRSTLPAAPGIRIAELFDGPGMQRLPANPAACYLPPGALRRTDESDDQAFHARPRLVQHLNASCRAELSDVFGSLLTPGWCVLDLMASHDSHLPAHDLTVCGLGMNEAELAANPRLIERMSHDLNSQPRLPWPDASFDAVINSAAIEYLVDPAAVVAEARRVLRPGGIFAIAFSDRWFPSKAIAVWGELHPFERLGLALHLLHEAGFAGLHSETRRGAVRAGDDRYAAQRNFADPLFVAWGYR